ncbi:MAG: glycosyltransferase family 4 protein [Gammaproteobacteria bacterium]
MHKVAVVHEWLVTYAGSEKALEQILSLFPGADLFCVLDYLPAEQRGFIESRKITKTFIQALPFSRKHYRLYLPLMPAAISRLDLSDYDVVISSCHAVAKGVRTNDKQIHLSYTYSPMRYVWDLQEQYLAETNLNKGIKGVLARYILGRLRKWDYRVAQEVDYFVAISKYIQQRIARVYQRESVVIYPPVDTDFFCPGSVKEEFYLTASRMVPYKMMPLIVSAFTAMPDKKLVVIGDGPEMKKVRDAAGGNVELLGYQGDNTMRDYMQRARCFIFAAEEDFGILPVEAQACGTPVVGYGAGGLLETINGLDDAAPTGVFFYNQNKQAIKLAVHEFEQNAAKINPENCRQKALDFSEDRFRANFRDYVNRILDSG